jgi:sodium/potassium-transporting ATPase subunit alpha
MGQFKNFIPPRAIVYREGVRKEIDAIHLVPGDIVEINIGENIPADVILIRTNEMKVNNASLTGESEDLLRNPDEKVPNIFESQNVAFFGTACTNGFGIGIVFKTGDETVIGQIASLASNAEKRKTTLEIEINKFIKLVGIMAIIMGLVFFVINFIYGYDILGNIILMIGIVVANVPEGIIITMTITLALAAKRMAVKKVLIKNM